MASNRTLEDVLQNAISARETLEAHVEVATSQNVVRPSLEALGWDVLDLSEVGPEFTVSDGTKVDYCLLLNGTPQVLVEVKSAGTSLDRHEQQLVNYAFQEGAPLAVLTNGFEWRFYLPRAPGKWHDRLFRTVVVEETPRKPAVAIREVLARKAIANGSAQKAAQGDLDQLARDRRLVAALPVAWDSLDIVKQLQDELEAKTGDRPRKPDLMKHLREHIGSGAPTSATSRSSRESPSAEQQTKGSAAAKKAWETRRANAARESDDDGQVATTPTTGTTSSSPQDAPRKARPATKVQAFWLDGTRHPVSHWAQIVVEVCDLLAVSDGPQFDAFATTFVGKNGGRHISPDKDSFTQTCRKLTRRELWVNTHGNAKRQVDFARKIIVGVRGNDNSFQTEPELQ